MKVHNIYLAGPDVFLPNAVEAGEMMKKQCHSYGFRAHFPLDNVIDEKHPRLLAEKIRLANVNLIEQCDVLIANLSPFRGPEPDSGTVWELGYAMGLGKQVVAYSSNLDTLKDRTQNMLDLNENTCDRDGMLIEDFGMTHNLMFAHCVVGKTLDDALRHLSETDKKER